MTEITNSSFWGNTILSWMIATGIFVACLLLITIFLRLFIVRLLKKWALRTKTVWDDFAVQLVEKSVVPALYVSSAYMSLQSLTLTEAAGKWIHGAWLAALTFFALRLISASFKKYVHYFLQRQENSADKHKQASGLIIIVNGIIWILGIIFLVDNLGYNVTTLIAGLGIGGIAIALAAQAILGDLFSYFVIFFDRPFEIGDFIIVDDKSGYIEHIGIKTTRIRTLGGEQLICSNTDLTNSRVHNYKRLARRRVVFSLGVTYQTAYSQLVEIPHIVKEIIVSHRQVEFDRAHFSGYGDFSLNFEFVYHVLDPEYKTFMDKQQAIYLDIFAAFEERKIDFAYPTQTLFIPSATDVA